MIDHLVFVYMFVYIVNSQSICTQAHLNKIKKLNDAKEIRDCLIYTAPVLMR